MKKAISLFLLLWGSIATAQQVWVPQQCVNGRCTPGHWETVSVPVKTKSPGCPCTDCKCSKCVCPPLESVVYQGALPTGVVKSGLATEPKYTFQGQEIGKEKAYAILGATDLIDDSKKATVSVIGPDKVRKETLSALKASLGDGFKYWEGLPEDWSFDPGFKKVGNPVTIYCQAPDGKVLHRQDDLDGGTQAAIEAIRKANPSYDPAIEAIRKANPSYDPAKDPDKRKADLPAEKSNLPFYLLLGLAAILFLKKKGS